MSWNDRVTRQWFLLQALERPGVLRPESVCEKVHSAAAEILEQS